jgi:hypothetical protein
MNASQTKDFIDEYLKKMCVTDGIFANNGDAYLEAKSLSYSFEMI